MTLDALQEEAWRCAESRGGHPPLDQVPRGVHVRTVLACLQANVDDALAHADEPPRLLAALAALVCRIADLVVTVDGDLDLVVQASLVAAWDASRTPQTAEAPLP